MAKTRKELFLESPFFSRAVKRAMQRLWKRETAMRREQAMPYVSFAIDDALSPRTLKDIPANARLVGWQCGFEPLFVAVFSYLDVRLDDADAEDIARDYLQEQKWFSDNENPPDADYII